MFFSQQGNVVVIIPKRTPWLCTSLAREGNEGVSPWDTLRHTRYTEKTTNLYYLDSLLANLAM